MRASRRACAEAVVILRVAHRQAVAIATHDGYTRIVTNQVTVIELGLVVVLAFVAEAEIARALVAIVAIRLFFTRTL